jgi:predicted Zn-dependent protease
VIATLDPLQNSLPHTPPMALLSPTEVPPEQLASFLSRLPIAADWVGLRWVEEIDDVRSARDGRPRNNGRSYNRGLMVEVLVEGQIGYGATNDLSPAGIIAAARAAHHQASTTQARAIHPWSIEQRPPVRGQYLPEIDPLDGQSAGAINDLLVKICQHLQVGDDIVQTRAMVNRRTIESYYVSSNGSNIHQRVALIVSDYGATAQGGSLTQTRSNGGLSSHCYQGGWDYFDRPQLWERVEQIGQQAVELLTADECPHTTTTLVLDPDQMLLQIHESIGHPLEIDRILGDERNYAGGSFVQPGDFGQLTYGSPLMNITFDPTVTDEFASYGFDDSGTPAHKEYLIKAGKLLRGLGGLDSQSRSHLPGVACSRACDWNRPPIDRMANINLEPGTQSFAEIIDNIEAGIYMESNRSWSIDDRRHKFQFGCEYARRIENGRLTTTLRDPNYRDVTPRFWQNLIAVGDRGSWRTYGSPYCGKGEPNQMIWVGHGSPVAAFAQVEVFGGS